MTISLLSNCEINQARLHSFVVMSHHFHMLVTPREDQTISQLVGKVKRQSALTIGPELNSYEKSQLKVQDRLNEHRFWKLSFRGLSVFSEEVFAQKAKYIEENPIRAGYVQESANYIWSSIHLRSRNLCEGSGGLQIRESIKYYEELLGTELL
jgi:putative transposase